MTTQDELEMLYQARLFAEHQIELYGKPDPIEDDPLLNILKQNIQAPYDPEVRTDIQPVPGLFEFSFSTAPALPASAQIIDQ